MATGRRALSAPNFNPIFIPMITENDKALLLRKGISEEKLNEQLACFAKGFPFLKLSAAVLLAAVNT